MSDEPKKRGPKPERLVIEGDPGVALDKLLGKRGGGMTFEDWKRHVEALIPGATCYAERGKYGVNYKGVVRIYSRPQLDTWSADDDAELRASLGVE